MSLILCADVIEGLQYLGTVISTDISRKLIANIVKIALDPQANIPTNPEIYASNSDFAKQSEYAVTTLFFLAIRFDYDSQKLRNILEHNAVNILIIEELIKVYEANRHELAKQNRNTGFTFPHITDVQWNIACDVKSSMSDTSSGELTFQINFGRYREKSGERETIAEFLCNTEELQSLISKLKDIERFCHKVANDGIF